MTETGHGLQIVSVTKSHSYVLEEDELENLLLRDDVKDLPVVVVSVAGAYRGGKSFLLNFFLRYFNSPNSARLDGSWLGGDSEPLAGFTWRSGIKATTMGILMWSEPFITTLLSGEKVAVLLVDTQGNFDSKSTVRDNSTIFALSTLVSSVQIYNLSHDIKEDDLQHLELFSEYGKLVNIAGSKKKAFQVLEFLVRDWQFSDDPKYPYGTVGGEQLLQDKLEITPDLPKEMKVLREHVLSSFEKVSCFLMPHPGFKVLKSSFKGNIKDIDIDFRVQLIDLVNSIFGPEKLLPKTINGERVKARELFNYFKTYMELFNSDEIPNPTNILAATVKAGLLSAVSEAHDIYEKGMKSECGPKELFVPAVDLKFLHEKYVTSACATYSNKKKMGSAEEIAEYLDKLTKALNERLSQYLLSNQSKIQTAITRAHDAYEEAIQNISKDQPLCVHAKDLEIVHETALNAAIKIYDAARKRVTQQKEDERATFIQEFQKQYQLQQKINKKNNDQAVTDLKNEYWQRMKVKASIDPPLTDAEFRNEHNIELQKSLQDFDSKRNMPNLYNEDVYKYNLSEEIQKIFIDLKMINKSKNKDAMWAAIIEYDSYMNEFWNAGTPCLHPSDLEEAHRLANCRALVEFRPKKECSGGFDNDDEDETTLKETLSKRHEDFKKNNDNANETAIYTAYNEYVQFIDTTRRNLTLWKVATVALAVVSWYTLFLTVPQVVSHGNKETVDEKAREKALEKFYEHRRDKTRRSGDHYKDRLDEMMNEYLQKNFG